LEFPHFIDLGKQAIQDDDWLQWSPAERPSSGHGVSGTLGMR